MKKLMTAIAVCAVAGFALADGSGVASANIVGYATVRVTGDNYGYQSVGVSFQNLKSVDGTYTIDDLFGNSVRNGDQIYWFDGEAYNFAYTSYSSSSGKWYYNDAFGNGVGYITPVFTNGSAFVYYKATAGDTNYIISGQVSQQNTTTFHYNDIIPFASKLPVEVTVSMLNTFCLNGDTIYTFDPVKYNFGYYQCNGNGTFAHSDSDGNFIANISGDTVVLPIGQGAFFSGSFNPGPDRVWTQNLP